MIGLVAVLKIKPGMEENVAAACLKMAEAVHRHEKECLLYEPFMPLEGIPEVYFLEKYTDMEALDKHRKTEHYLTFKNAITDAITEPPMVTLLKPIG